MIKGFKDGRTAAIFARRATKGVPTEVQKRALAKLIQIDSAESVNDLRSPPGNHLEQLQGKRAGEYSIRVNAQWRICFVWREGHPDRVGLEDYH